MKSVSIIIPVYNGSKYIERCLQSVVCQTYDMKQLECILIDDCSTDNSHSIISSYINNYNGDIDFRIVQHQENLGASACRNTGLHEAIGDYVFFLDCDDTITPDCISVLIEIAGKYPQAEFIQANTVTGRDELMPYSFSVIPPVFCDDHLQLCKLILSTLTMTIWNRLIRRSFLMDNNLSFQEGIVCEDMYWIYFLAKATHAAAFINRPTYLYYRNDSSVMNSTSKSSLQKHFYAHIVAAEAFLKDLKNSTDSNLYQRQYLASNMVSTLSILCRLNKISDWWQFWKLTLRIARWAKPYSNTYRLLLFLCLMPPLCFLIGNNSFIWRVKQYIVNKIS